MNYYNENDKRAAKWLRNLIAVGLIPDGDIDDRSIEDVKPEDIEGYVQCHFFAGIGGWSYALRLAGWPDDRQVWTGSCPCQPFSAAGKRRGAADSRHLWPAFWWLIEQRRPPTVFGEQVASKAGRSWLAGVQADLEALAYRFGAADLCAAGVGAPHIRQRLWWVADTESAGQQTRRSDRAITRHGEGFAARPGCAGGGLGDADDAGSQGRGVLSERAGERSPWASSLDNWLPCADGKARRIKPGLEPLVARLSDSLGRCVSIERSAIAEVEQYAKSCQADPNEVLQVVRRFVQARASWEEKSTGMREQLYAPEVLLPFLLCLQSARKAGFGSGVPKAGSEVHRRVLRCVRLPEGVVRASCRREPTEQRPEEFSDALHMLSLILARHAEAHWSEAVCAHAATGRVAQLRGYGNAIVPQVAEQFIRAYMDIPREQPKMAETPP